MDDYNSETRQHIIDGISLMYVSAEICFVLLLLFFTFSALVAKPKKTNLHGGQSARGLLMVWVLVRFG